MWQRSLYNVKGLRAQPWWTAKETGYTDLVKVKDGSSAVRPQDDLCLLFKFHTPHIDLVRVDTGAELDDHQGRGFGCDQRQRLYG